jgi:GxxExxY protein
MDTDSEIVYEKESYEIIGACIDVYKELGCGFLESVYQECLEHEFRLRNIPFNAQPWLELTYKTLVLNKSFQPDFVCFSKIIVELKAVPKILDEHKAQLLNYLKATNMKLGILVNFGHYPKLEQVRILL